MQNSKRDKIVGNLKLVVDNETDSPYLPLHLADHIPALFFVYDIVDNRILYMNRRTSELLKSTPESDSAQRDLLRLVYKDDLPQFLESLDNSRTLPEGQTRHFDLRLNDVTEEYRVFRITVSPGQNHNSVVFFGEDITDTWRSDKEVNTLKELCNETELLLSYGSWKWNARTGKINWSEGMYRLMEYSPDELKEEITLDFFLKHLSAKDRRQVEDLFYKSLANRNSYEVNFDLHTAAGTHKFLTTKGKPVIDSDGNVTGVMGVTIDITAQNTILTNLSDYRRMMLDKEKFLGSGSWEYFFESGVTSWSEGNYRLFGYDPDSHASLPEVSQELFRKHMTQQEIENVRKNWEIIKNEKSEHTWNFEIHTLDGEKKTIETYARLLLDNFGNPFRIIGASRDITTIREFEDSLRQKIEELDRSNKELEEFAYIASHDLQEPLRKITAFSERLKEKASEEIGREGNLYLDRMMVATENMRILIDNLLEFSRTSRHNQPFSHVDLNKIIEEVEAELELKIEETDATIHVETLPVIEGIASQIRQLFMNLLSNAIKFRKVDEKPVIEITVSSLSKKDKESFRLRADMNYFRIIVSDNGIGFDPEYAQKIFQIFQRLHGKSEYPGSGIGLAICKKIADNHNGLIYAESEPEKGARFIIFIPENQL